MKKIILLLLFFSLPTFTFSTEGNTRSLESYRIWHPHLRYNINQYVIPFLTTEGYLPSKNFLKVYFKSYNSFNYIHVSLIVKDEITWNDDIIGYCDFAGYTCILSGKGYNKFVKKTLFNFPKKIVFNKPRIPYNDGIIEWLFRLEGETVKLISFNSEW